MITESNNSTVRPCASLVYRDEFLRPATFKKLQLIESTFSYRADSRTYGNSDNKSSHYFFEADDQFRQSKLMSEILETFSSCVGKKLSLRRAIFRRSQFGEFNEVHQDYFVPGHEEHFFTGILFLNQEWKLDWRGEFSIVDIETKTSCSVYPKMNRAIIFPSFLSHTVSPPSRECYEHRIVLVLNMHEDK